MVSRPCDHCIKIKRCEMVVDASGRLGYLCGACKLELDYPVRDEAATASRESVLWDEGR